MDPTLTVSHTGDVARDDLPELVPALVLLWSRDEPHRVGEVALLPGSGVTLLGRAEPTAGDPAHRALFARQRPGRLEPTGALRSPHVSREQLRIELGDGGALAVTNVGRCPMRVNDAPADRADLLPGDVVELQQQALLLVTRRPLAVPPFPAGTPLRLHGFGDADAHGLVGESPVAWELRERIAFVAGRHAHVLVRGPSGVGKELVAQAIHTQSDRRRRALVARNAATFPETLIDAELFGNAKNYPNPSMPERPGLIGEADGSTLFLDEFGELPIAMQSHLLRVLDAGEYTRLGEARPRRADLRLVAATNRPEEALKEDVLARFRLRVHLPGLDARREDVPLIARHLLRRIAADDPALARRFFPDGDAGRPPRVSSALVAALVGRRYTTHVRELEAVLWRSLQQSRGDVLEPAEEDVVAAAGRPPPSGKTSSPGNRSSPGKTSSPPKTSSAGTPPGDGKIAAEDPLSIPPEVVQAVLDKHGGRQEPAWRELGLSSRHVLTRLVRRYGLSVRGRSRED